LTMRRRNTDAHAARANASGTIDFMARSIVQVGRNAVR
jgi:hypothetical protein